MARQMTLLCLNAGIKVNSSGVSQPCTCVKTVPKYFGAAFRLMNAPRTATRSGGRGTAISRSRPIKIVSLWCRVWLERHTLASRNTINDAISWTILFVQSVLKAVPCSISCQRASDVEAYTTA